MMSAIDDIRGRMSIRTPAGLGAVIREHRKLRGWDQAQLAKRIGASRQWVIAVEKGRARAELGLVLRAINALGLQLEAFLPNPRPKNSSSPDIDAIVAAATKKAAR
jgi:HTH-type transcriptional regulator / antitoxin HipB